MDFKQLNSFVAVSKYKSFSTAAEKLFISQPTISTHIRLLEEELESKLIIRSPKYLELTPRGAQFFEFATTVLNMQNDLMNSWSEQGNTIIRISASTLPSTYVLPEVLPAFNQLHPNTYFNIHQSDSTNVLQDILDDKCSLGITGMYSDNDKIECVPFYEDNVVIITPVTEHYLQYKKSDSLNIHDLLKEPIIIRESGSGTQKRADLLFKQMNIKESELNIVARVNDPEAIKNLVSGEMGISLISHKAAKNLEAENRILVFPIPEYNMTRKMYLIYKKNYIFPKSVLVFINYLKSFYL